MSKVINVIIGTSEVFVQHADNGPEIWIPATPAAIDGVTAITEDGRAADVHAVMIVKTPAAYSRLFAGKTFPNPVQIMIHDWEKEWITLPNDTVDVVCRKVAFLDGAPFPAPTLDALAKEMTSLDNFYHTAMEIVSPVKHEKTDGDLLD